MGTETWRSKALTVTACVQHFTGVMRVIKNQIVTWDPSCCYEITDLPVGLFTSPTCLKGFLDPCTVHLWLFVMLMLPSVEVMLVKVSWIYSTPLKKSLWLKEAQILQNLFPLLYSPVCKCMLSFWSFEVSEHLKCSSSPVGKYFMEVHWVELSYWSC